MEKEVDSKIFLIAIIAIVVIVLISSNFSLTGEPVRKATKSTTTNVAPPKIYIDQTTYFDREGVPQTTVYHGTNWDCTETRFGYGGTYQVGTYPTTNLARSLIKSGLIANEMVTKNYGDTNWICMNMESHPQTNSPEWVVRSTKETSWGIITSSRNEIPINSYSDQNNRLKYSGTSKTSEYYRTGK